MHNNRYIRIVFGILIVMFLHNTQQHKRISTRTFRVNAKVTVVTYETLCDLSFVFSPCTICDSHGVKM